MNREILKWIVVCLLILSIILYDVYETKKIERDGIITIAKVDKYETNVSGGDMHISIFYKQKEYKSVINTICIKCTGKYYFVKILDQDPGKNVILLDNIIVPQCLLSKPIPYDGWKEIPKCG